MHFQLFVHCQQQLKKQIQNHAILVALLHDPIFDFGQNKSSTADQEEGTKKTRWKKH
jgi:hypothetical protein